ncbi:MAG TPA: cytochrome c [Candidatus Acidoferrales bacterium]|jgi:cytochrome c oxidase cbb3-type subunit 3|nr:cytochrome c [Candidatus Acidoferrales bacterium]
MRIPRVLASASIELLMTASLAFTQATRPPTTPAKPGQTFPDELVRTGETLFVQHCAFCHGRDTGGGESGPDLTRSKLVADDIGGNQIGPVVRNGRNNMPRFTVTDQELLGLTAFIRTQKNIAESQKGGRKGVDEKDLVTGNIDKGKEYFNGTGKCNSCHSPTGDLAGVATRNGGLKLIQRLMYPRGAKAKVTVTLPSGETVSGTRAYLDEFTVALRDASGRYRSWPAAMVKVRADDPAEAHVDLLAKYTDDDIHNLMTYLMTLK